MKLLKFFKRQLIILCSFLKGQVMLLTFYLFPQWTYLFVPKTYLPDRNNRISKKSNPFDEFTLVEEFSDQLPVMDEIHVVMGGVSFDRRHLKDLKGPKYLVNWSEKADLPDVTYVTGDQNYFQSFINKNMFPVLFVFVELEQIVRQRPLMLMSVIKAFLNDKRCKQIWCTSPFRSMGSGIDAVIALSKFAKKINIYGWDQYMKIGPQNTNFFSLHSILSISVTPYNCDQIVGHLRSFNCAIRFSRLKNVKNYGYTSKMSGFSDLTKRLEKVFYI